MSELEVAKSKGNVSTEEERLVVGSGWKSSPPPDPASISNECLSAAEDAAQQVFNCIHPRLDSEEKRRDVIDYIQQLVKSHCNCEVVSYGSVPLKTYLPDGDIDLTVLRGPNAEESLAHDVLGLLQGEEQNENAEYQVKETQFIDAEVKLVKSFVRNIVIDISFNQLGGISTLCFLEQVDRLVGRNHLFKRSIILVKTWCYYESRILGAHHGLISTYAMEMLVLYIFHFFHSSLSGPLAVLYRFLDYYSQFDWENYCISLEGPVCISSLPDIVVKMPESGWKDRMLSEEFLESCMEMFSVSSRELEANPRPFQTKHLNIIDPLKENNNLGRSVHRGICGCLGDFIDSATCNAALSSLKMLDWCLHHIFTSLSQLTAECIIICNFYRIRSALKYGARKLGEVLLRPKDKVADGICEFFTNTLARHGHEYRSGTRCLALEFDDDESLPASAAPPVELSSEDDMLLETSFSDLDNNVEEKPSLEFKNELERCSITSETSEACYPADGVFGSEHCIIGEANDLATANSSLRNGLEDHISSSNHPVSLSENHLHEQSLKSSAGNGSSEAHQIDLACDLQKSGLNSCLENREKHVEMDNTNQWCMENSEAVWKTGSTSTQANIFGNQSLDFREIDSTNTGDESEDFDPLADLSGDYDSHLRSLLRGQLSRFASSAPVVRNPPLLPSMFQNKNPWDIVRQSMPLGQNQFSQMNSHLISMEHAIYPAPDSTFFGTAFHSEGIQKARGTGTYFPQVNVSHMERPSHGRGRNKALGNHNKYGHKNGLHIASGESNSFENGSREVLHIRSRFQGRGRSPRSVGNGDQTNGYLSGSCRIEFGSIGTLAEEVISGSAHLRGSTPGAPLKTQGSTAMMNRERVAGQSIHLKNEVEFPPLCQ